MLDRFEFDTVLFPINFVQYANPEDRRNTGELLRQCREREVGVQVWFMLGGLIAIIMGVGAFFVSDLLYIEDRAGH